MALGARLDELFQSGFDHLLKKLSCSSGREREASPGNRCSSACWLLFRSSSTRVGSTLFGWVRNTQEPGKSLTIPGTCFP